MTRTARSASLRALMKDRSESKNNRDNGMRKGGAGQHNWGAMRDEAQLEDVERDVELELSSGEEQEQGPPAPAVKGEGMTSGRRASIAEDVVSAKEFRKHAFEKGELDLSAIARTSSAVASPPPSATVPL